MVNSTGVKTGLAPVARFDVQACRNDFPALHQEVSAGCPLIYLDSAATSLKPEPVVRAVTEYLAIYPANVHRGLHTLSERATEAFEGAREKVAAVPRHRTTRARSSSRGEQPSRSTSWPRAGDGRT